MTIRRYDFIRNEKLLQLHEILGMALLILRKIDDSADSKSHSRDI